MGLVRSLWLVSTLVVVGPTTMVGVLNLLDGQYSVGALFIGLAVAFVVISELAYLRFTDRTVGRLKRLMFSRKDGELDE